MCHHHEGKAFVIHPESASVDRAGRALGEIPLAPSADRPWALEAFPPAQWRLDLACSIAFWPEVRDQRMTSPDTHAAS